MDRMKNEVYWARYSLREWWHDRLPRAIAWMLPRRVVYHAVIRAWVFAASGRHATEHPDSVSISQLTARWREEDH